MVKCVELAAVWLASCQLVSGLVGLVGWLVRVSTVEIAFWPQKPNLSVI